MQHLEFIQLGELRRQCLYLVAADVDHLQGLQRAEIFGEGITPQLIVLGNQSPQFCQLADLIADKSHVVCRNIQNNQLLEETYSAGEAGDVIIIQLQGV